jgi:hypothetical protein
MGLGEVHWIAFRSDVKTPICTFQERYFQRNYCNGEMLLRSASESYTFRIGGASSTESYTA